VIVVRATREQLRPKFLLTREKRSKGSSRSVTAGTSEMESPPPTAS